MQEFLAIQQPTDHEAYMCLYVGIFRCESAAFIYPYNKVTG